MPRGEPLDRDLAAALLLLDAIDLPYADVWRKLAPIAAALGRPQPSYHCVRAFVIAERRRKIARMKLVDTFLVDAFAMRGPMRSLDALVEYNTSPEAGPAPGRSRSRARARPRSKRAGRTSATGVAAGDRRMASEEPPGERRRR